jgi:hypothetical protein
MSSSESESGYSDSPKKIDNKDEQAKIEDDKDSEEEEEEETDIEEEIELVCGDSDTCSEDGTVDAPLLIFSFTTIELQSKLSKYKYHCRSYLNKIPTKKQLQTRWYNRAYFAIARLEKKIVRYLLLKNISLKFKDKVIRIKDLQSDYKGYRLYRKYLVGRVVDDRPQVLHLLITFHSQMEELITLLL